MKKPTISRLPDGFTELAYIQSSGSQHINTMFKPKYNTRVIAEVSNVPAAYGFLFGARNTASSGQFTAYRTDTGLRSDYFGSQITETLADATPRTTVDKNANVTTMWGKTITNAAVTSGQCNYPLFLFSMNSAGTSTVPGSFKLYSCKIYDGAVFIRDYVPALRDRDGAVGLYDMVNGEFYENAGTGTFIGSEVAA